MNCVKLKRNFIFQCVPDLRSSIDEALLRVITVNPAQNEVSNSCLYLDLNVKPEGQNGSSLSKVNSSSSPTSLADVVPIDDNVIHPSNPLTSQYYAPVCMVSHLPSSLNRDLAEADQSMENDVTNNENAANSPEIPIAMEQTDMI